MSIYFIRPAHCGEKVGQEWICLERCEKRGASFFFCSGRESDVYSCPFMDEYNL